MRFTAETRYLIFFAESIERKFPNVLFFVLNTFLLLMVWVKQKFAQKEPMFVRKVFLCLLAFLKKLIQIFVMST